MKIRLISTQVHVFLLMRGCNYMIFCKVDENRCVPNTLEIRYVCAGNCAGKFDHVKIITHLRVNQMIGIGGVSELFIYICTKRSK